MTSQGERAAQVWREPSFARAWADNDAIADLLGLPRAMAAALVADDRPDTAVVLDVASGPGDFLATLLDRLPGARGIWTDASPAMQDLATERLKGFASRTEFRLVDMTALPSAGLPTVDALLSSRASHHLDADGVAAFYRDAARLVAPGGWLVNLDHVGPPDAWDRRYRATRRQFHRAAEGPKHHHTYPLTSEAQHLGALHAAGIDDVDVAWKAFYTCLFVGRRDG
jgi:SAM-dependent methyltransferase